MEYDILSFDVPTCPLVAIESVHPVAIASVQCRDIREHQAMLLGDELTDAARRAGWLLAISFEKVEHLTSACLNMLVELHLCCRHNGGSLVVFGLPDEVQRIIRVTRLDTRIPVAADRAHACAILGETRGLSRAA